MPRDRYYAIRFVDEDRYRVTSKRCSNASAAATELFGVPLFPRMVVASFNKAWKNMTVAEKLAVESVLGLPLKKDLCINGHDFSYAVYPAGKCRRCGVHD